MSDLESLFEASDRPNPRRSAPKTEEPGAKRPELPVVTSGDAQDLRVRDLEFLVGSRRDIALSSPPDLSRLVGPVHAARRDPSAALSLLVGPASFPDDVEPPPRAAVGSAGLRDFVGTVGNGPDGMSWTAPELARRGKRPMFARRRAGAVNVLSVAVSIVAVLVLVAAASFALVQRATANPAGDAMASLLEREAELMNEIDQLRTATGMYSASLDSARASTAAALDVLPRLGQRVPADLLNAAQTAQADLERLAAQSAPAPFPDYSRGSVNERSVVDVGRALDKVREIEQSLTATMRAVREARGDLVNSSTAFRDALVAVGAALQANAAERVAAAAAADESFRAAVVAAIDGMTRAQAAGGDGLSEMSASVSALDALDSENQRVLDERRNAADGSTRGTDASRSSSPPASLTPSPSPPAPAPEDSTSPDPQPLPSPSPAESASGAASASVSDVSSP